MAHRLNCCLSLTLLIIALFIPIYTQITTQTYTSATSKFVVLTTTELFDWFAARRQCLDAGYLMSIVTSIADHDNMVSVVQQAPAEVTTCWLGAFGFFISASGVTNNSIHWTWESNQSLSFNQTLAALYYEPFLRVSFRATQGLLLRRSRNSAWDWSNAVADFNDNATGRQCVVCLDMSTTLAPTPLPTTAPSPIPTLRPTQTPTGSPTDRPSLKPSISPSLKPTQNPTLRPSLSPSASPTDSPTLNPTGAPTQQPSSSPTPSPSLKPSVSPSLAPTSAPTQNPTLSPTAAPTQSPTLLPSTFPSFSPTSTPTFQPSLSPSRLPTTHEPTEPGETREPSMNPSFSPTNYPSVLPTVTPTGAPTTTNPTSTTPTSSPSQSPTTTTTTTLPSSLTPATTTTLAPTTSDVSTTTMTGAPTLANTRSLDPTTDSMAELILNPNVQQTCDWQSLECNVCLEVLYLTDMDEDDNLWQLMAREVYTPDTCRCVGGIGQATTAVNVDDDDIHELGIDSAQNMSRLHFQTTAIDDVVTVAVYAWRYSGVDAISMETANPNTDADTDTELGDNACVLQYFVNRNIFLDVAAADILRIEFDVFGFDLDVIEQLQQLLVAPLETYFLNRSHAYAESVTVSLSWTVDTPQRRRRRRLLLSEDVVCHMSVHVFTASAIAANATKLVLQTAETEWISDVQLLLSENAETATETDSFRVENTRYTLLSTVDDEDAVDEGPHPPTPGFVVIIVLVVIFCAAIIMCVLCACWCHKRGKYIHSIEYQSPKITMDNISDAQLNTHESAPLHKGEGGGDNVTHMQQLLCSDDGATTSDDDAFAMPKNTGDEFAERVRAADDDDAGDGGDIDAYQFTGHDVQMAEFGSTTSSYSARTSLLHFELDSKAEEHDLLHSVIAALCTSASSASATMTRSKPAVISDDQLSIHERIGAGYFGEVFVGTFNGTKVAIKQFSNLDMSVEPSVPICDDREHDPPLALMPSASPTKHGHGGYSSLPKLDDDDEEDDDGEDDNKSDLLSDDPVSSGLPIAVSERQSAAIRKKRLQRKQNIFAELVLAASLPYNPNLCPIIGIAAAAPTSTLKVVLRYYDGGNLQSFIYRDRRVFKQRISVHSVLILLRPIAEAILFLHNHKMVHRDIAARNVLLGDVASDGQIQERTAVVLSDYGMTRCMTQTAEKTQMSGPLKWMAPESIAKHKYTYKSDVYMLAMTMFEILHGKAPFSHAKFAKFSLPVLSTKIVKLKQRPLIDVNEEMAHISMDHDQQENTVLAPINRLMRNGWSDKAAERPTMLTVLHTLNSVYDSMLGLS